MTAPGQEQEEQEEEEQEMGGLQEQEGQEEHEGLEEQEGKEKEHREFLLPNTMVEGCGGGGGMFGCVAFVGWVV